MSSLDIEEKYIHDSFSSTMRERLSSGLPTFSIQNPNAPYIFVLIKEEFQVAGDRVRAEIILDVPSSIGRADLFFYSQGAEDLRVYKALKLASYNRNEIYIINTIIRTWEDLLEGQYIIPISFKLPQYAPPTFVYAGEDSFNNFIKTEISYQISARIIYKDNEFTHSRPLYVRSAETRSASRIMHMVSEPASNSCCSYSGTSEFKLEVLMDEHSSCRDIISYRIIPDNRNSALPITEITGQVVRVLKFMEKEKIYSIKNLVSEATRTVLIPARSDAFIEKDFLFTNQLNSGSLDINPASVDSVLVKCTYFIEFLVKYNSSRKKKNLVMRIPFHTNPTCMPYGEVPLLPFEWKGEVHPIINLMIESK